MLIESLLNRSVDGKNNDKKVKTSRFKERRKSDFYKEIVRKSHPEDCCIKRSEENKYYKTITEIKTLN